MAIDIQLDDTAGAARQSCHPQTAGVGKGVQDAPPAQVLDGPPAQLTRVQVQTGIPVHAQVKGIPHPVLLHFHVRRSAKQEPAPPLLGRGAVTYLDDPGPQPGQPGLQESLCRPDQVPSPFRGPGIVVQDGGRPIQVHHQVGTALGETVEQAQGTGVPGIEKLRPCLGGFLQQGHDGRCFSGRGVWVIINHLSFYCVRGSRGG